MWHRVSRLLGIGSCSSVPWFPDVVEVFLSIESVIGGASSSLQFEADGIREAPEVYLVAWYWEAPGHARGPKPVRAIAGSTALWLFRARRAEVVSSQSVPSGAVPPGGVSEHLWPGRTWTPDTTSTVRPRCPKRTGGEQAARDPACATLRGVGPGVGVPLGMGWPEQYSARHTTCSDPSAKKGNTRVHPAALCTRGEHLHHSHNTHSRSHSGTPHAQHSDARTVFHVSAYACGAGVSQTATNLPDLLPGRPAA